MPREMHVIGLRDITGNREPVSVRLSLVGEGCMIRIGGTSHIKRGLRAFVCVHDMPQTSMLLLYYIFPPAQLQSDGCITRIDAIDNQQIPASRLSTELRIDVYFSYRIHSKPSQ